MNVRTLINNSINNSFYLESGLWILSAQKDKIKRNNRKMLNWTFKNPKRSNLLEQGSKPSNGVFLFFESWLVSATEFSNSSTPISLTKFLLSSSVCLKLSKISLLSLLLFPSFPSSLAVPFSSHFLKPRGDRKGVDFP